MPEQRTIVKATVSKQEIIRGLQDLTLDHPDFDHHLWSIYESEVLEKAAKMIRDGYGDDKPPIRDYSS